MLLNIFVYITFALLLIDSALLLLVVLMQRPKQEGLGAAFGSQMTDQVFGAQTTDVLKKATALFGTLFMILCFVLGVLMNAQADKRGLGETKQAAPVQQEQQGGAFTVSADPTTAPTVDPTTAPAAETPAPAVETPAPAAETPAPAVETPAPAAEVAPAPAVETPAPAAEETPAPAAA